MRLTSRGCFLKRLAIFGASAAAAMVSQTAFAVTITVTNLDDDGPGSFRQALREARANDVINFAVTGTIVVRSLPLQPGFTGPIFIQGPGADRLAVSGNGLVRVFSFFETIVTMSGLTIRDGNSRAAPVFNTRGGGIHNEGDLTLNDCVIINNQGGGIDSSGFNFEVNRCTIANNTTLSARMGEPIGVSVAAGITATRGTITNSTIVNNEAINQDLTDPAEAVRAGGISSSHGVRIIGCTITGNRISGSSGFPGAGGVADISTMSPITVTDSIIAGNTFAPAPDVHRSFTSGGYSLIGNKLGSTGFTHGLNQDQVGGVDRPVIDPRLGALSNNGGPTLTVPLLSDSPAIDQGLSSLSTDQRGAARRFDVAGVPTPLGGDGSDVGAFEFGSAVSGLVPVNVVSRKTHGDAGAFDISLLSTATGAVEGRARGPGSDHTIIFSFPNALSSVGGAAVTSGTGTVSTSGIGSDARQYIVNLTGVTNAQRITVTLSNVIDSSGNSSSSVPASMGVLVGDTNGNGAVTASDIGEVKAQSGQAVTAMNFRTDANVSGSVTAYDIGLVKSASGTQLP